MLCQIVKFPTKPTDYGRLTILVCGYSGTNVKQMSVYNYRNSTYVSCKRTSRHQQRVNY